MFSKLITTSCAPPCFQQLPTPLVCVPMMLCVRVPMMLCVRVPMMLVVCVPVMLCVRVPMMLVVCVPVMLCVRVPMMLVVCVPMMLCVYMDLYWYIGIIHIEIFHCFHGSHLTLCVSSVVRRKPLSLRSADVAIPSN